MPPLNLTRSAFLLMVACVTVAAMVTLVSGAEAYYSPIWRWSASGATATGVPLSLIALYRLFSRPQGPA